jgi:hypothetical protein
VQEQDGYKVLILFEYDTSRDSIQPFHGYYRQRGLLHMSIRSIFSVISISQSTRHVLLRLLWTGVNKVGLESWSWRDVKEGEMGLSYMGLGTEMMGR